jgi:hypothetical protein
MRFANFWTFLVLFAIATWFSLVLFPRQAEHYPGPTIDGTQFGVTPQEAKDIVQKFADAGQDDEYLEQEIQLDLVFPVVYSLMLAVAIIGLGRPFPVARWLVLLPFLAALGDYLENLSAIVMLGSVRDGKAIPDAWAWGAAIGSRWKWGSLIASLLAIVYVAWRRIRRR